MSKNDDSKKRLKPCLPWWSNEKGTEHVLKLSTFALWVAKDKQADSEYSAGGRDQEIYLDGDLEGMVCIGKDVIKEFELYCPL